MPSDKNPAGHFLRLPNGINAFLTQKRTQRANQKATEKKLNLKTYANTRTF